MNILFVSGMPHLPQAFGGIEINTDEWAIELNRRGHQAAVLAKLSLRDRAGLAQLIRNMLSGRGVSRDIGLGYEVWRWRPRFSPLQTIPRPDVVVVQNGKMVQLANRFARCGVRSVAYLHNLAFEGRDWPRSDRDLPFDAYIANSRFTAGRFQTRFGIKPRVIPPVFNPDRYRAVGDRNVVTLINPIAAKGSELACEIAARCPDIPFRFVKSWRLRARDVARLTVWQLLLSNLEILDVRSDMRPIYAATRVLLAPSQCEEAWGRVVAEAQFSGIPVLGSDAGGLPDAIGPGGTIISQNAAVEVWVQELRRLWHDRDYFEWKSRQALAHAGRPELAIDSQSDALLAILQEVIALPRRGPSLPLLQQSCSDLETSPPAGGP